MSIITYTSQFKEVLNQCKQNELFLGLGNPNAKILIIGKEAAIDKEKDPRHYEVEVKNNVKDWEQNYELNKQLEEVLNWFEESAKQKYNPLFPYKGQKNKIESRNKNGEIIRGNGGTSKTWNNYQKITDIVYNDNKTSDLINFHEKVFISELNQESAKYSYLIAKETREDSINKRMSLFESNFFREFPITIVAVGHYVRDFNVNLEELFGVKFDQHKSLDRSNGLKNEYINIHFDSILKPTRLLIHTNQLSMVSNELIKRIGEVCSGFINDKFKQ